MRTGGDDLVLGQQHIEVAEALARFRQHLSHALNEVVRDVPDQATGPEVAVHQPLAGRLFKDVLNVLALPEAVGERGAKVAEIDAERAQEHKVAADPVQLAEDDADVLRPLRHLQLQQLLDGHAVGLLIHELGQVVRPVLVADGRAVVHRLGELLGAAMHVADVRLDVLHALAIDGQHHAKDAVSAGVLRPHVDVDVDGVYLLLLYHCARTQTECCSQLASTRRLP